LELHTNIPNPLLYAALLLLGAAGLVAAIYFFRKRDDELLPWQSYLLGGIKLSYLLLIGYLLFSPMVTLIQQKIEKPLLLIGVDNSESMISNQDMADSIAVFIEKLKQKGGDKFEVETLLFGERIIKTDSLQFNGKRSNYANFFTDIEQRYFNLNLGAVVMLGDGIYNEGRNPEQLSSNIDAPVYTLGIGDTLSRTDQAIVAVNHNPNVFKGNNFQLETEISFKAFPHKSSRLMIYQAGKLVVSEQIEVLQSDYFFSKNYSLTADEVGLQNISVLISPVTSELNKLNNRYNFTIEVHDNRKDVLFLSQGPHPDIGAFTQTLNQQANFNIEFREISAFTGSVNDYDLIVLNQLPSLMTQQSDIYTQLTASEVPLLVLTGPKTSIAALNNMQLGFQIEPSAINEESAPFFNEAFSLFSLPENIGEVENIYPPLLTRYTKYSFDAAYSVLAYQRVKGIEMNYPLISAGEVKGRKTAVILGEGIWRWRMREYQYYDKQQAFNQLTVNLFNYLSVENTKDQFKIDYERITPETSPLIIKAQVFNKIFEPVEQANISLVLTDSLNNELSYLFDAGNAGYELNLGLMNAGNYSFEASTTLGDETFQRSGSFSVQEVNIEQQELQADFGLMHRLAIQNNGRFFTFDQQDLLLEQVMNNSSIQAKTHNEKNSLELIGLKWYLLLILLLFGLEWFLRKYWGTY
jgi:hypothetical protein